MASFAVVVPEGQEENAKRLVEQLGLVAMMAPNHMAMAQKLRVRGYGAGIALAVVASTLSWVLLLLLWEFGVIQFWWSVNPVAGKALREFAHDRGREKLTMCQATAGATRSLPSLKAGSVVDALQAQIRDASEVAGVAGEEGVDRRGDHADRHVACSLEPPDFGLRIVSLEQVEQVLEIFLPFATPLRGNAQERVAAGAGRGRVMSCSFSVRTVGSVA